MNKTLSNQNLFDDNFPQEERLPRLFDVSFREISISAEPRVVITINGTQIGDIITDNSYTDDGYRFHDVFHFSYVAFLGWSPCVRKMLKRKRKSVPKVDEVEDGARAIITEEAIALLIYNDAREHNLFEYDDHIAPSLLQNISKMAANFEIKNCKSSDWEKAILKGYAAFRYLIKNKGGIIKIDMLRKDLSY
jgi:hypothetical protein